MKILNLFKRIKPQLPSNEKGQTILEFALLLLVIVTVSFSFVALINLRLASVWEYVVNIVVYDKPVKNLKIKE
jgi:hypothetical protein